jgi:hypothetical protein
MVSDDWLDVEPFFDDVIAELDALKVDAERYRSLTFIDDISYANAFGAEYKALYTTPPNTQAKTTELTVGIDTVARLNLNYISDIAKIEAKLAKAREALELAKVTFIANKMDVRNVMEIINDALKD